MLVPREKNPTNAKCFSGKTTNCSPFTQLLVGFPIKHFAVGGLLEKALRSWWIFIERCLCIQKLTQGGRKKLQKTQTSHLMHSAYSPDRHKKKKLLLSYPLVCKQQTVRYHCKMYVKKEK